MPFEFSDITELTITNANPRVERHGEEMVRAIDISWSITGENTLLDLIEPGLREHHYFNKALKEGQTPLPEVIVPLPNLRHPNLPLAYAYAKGQKWRGYRFIRDFGTEEAHFDFTDAVLTNLHYELNEGGSVKLMGTTQYNGDELQDNAVYGELSGLASEGTIYAKLLAPAELMPAKKGYRAGKPDTHAASEADDGQGSLVDADDDQDDFSTADLDDEGGNPFPVDADKTEPQDPFTPEQAFTAAVAGGADVPVTTRRSPLKSVKS